MAKLYGSFVDCFLMNKWVNRSYTSFAYPKCVLAVRPARGPEGRSLRAGVQVIFSRSLPRRVVSDSWLGRRLQDG